MSEADDINAVVRVLRTIPPKKLRIIELINSVPIKNGECEFDRSSKPRPRLRIMLMPRPKPGARFWRYR